MSLQLDPSGRSRSRSRSRSISHVATEIDGDTSLDETATIVQAVPLQTPQIAPGHREHRYPAALDEKETRQLLRFQSIRQWWCLRGRAHNSGGVDCKLLKLWTNAKFPASPTNIVDGIPLAGSEWNVVVDPVKEKALWDTWGRQAWLTIVATEKDWVEDKGYLWGMDPVHFATDRSLFELPSSPFINIAP
jgi:hypothetical protein